MTTTSHEAGLTSLQRIFRAKQEKLQLRHKMEEDWQHFLNLEAKILEDFLREDELDPLTELQSDKAVATPVSSHSVDTTANGDSDSYNAEEQPSHLSSERNAPVTVTDMLQEEQEEDEPHNVEDMNAQESLDRCRIEAEEVFDRTYLDMKNPKKQCFAPPLSVVERDECAARKKLQTAEQSFRYAIRDYREADRNYITRALSKREEEPEEQPEPEPEDESVAAPEPEEESVAAPEPEEESVAAPEPEEESVAAPEPEDELVKPEEEPEPEPEEEPEEEEVEPQQGVPQQKSESPTSGESLAERPETSQPEPHQKEVRITTPKKGKKKKSEKAWDAVDESPARVRDEIFPGAHEIMLNLLYEVYGLMPSSQFRMTSMDFFDSVSAVGTTLNMEEYDETMPYKPDVSPAHPPEGHIPATRLWTDEHLFSYVDTWLDQMSAKKQVSSRRERRESVDGRGLFAPYYSSNGKRRKGRSPVDWVMLNDCCIVLVNGLGTAFAALHKAQKRDECVTEDHVRDWTLQYIHYGLQRLLRDQTAAHSVTFRSVFSLLSSNHRRRVLYPVFETTFLSQVVSKNTMQTIQEKTNIDYHSAFIKKQGVTYLPFSMFLRQLCNQIRGISLLKLRQILESIMQPATAVKLLRFIHVPVPGFPVHLVRRGLDCLAGMTGALQSFVKFLEVEPKRGPAEKEGDKSAQDLLRVVVQRSSIEVATHAATKCLLILVLFVNWMETDFKDVEEGLVDVRFWTQRVFAEANSYYRIAQNPSSEEDQKSVCADVVALFYSFFDTRISCEFLKYVKSKPSVDLETLSTLRQQINDALQATGKEAKELRESKAHDKSSDHPVVVSDDENFNERPDGPLLLRRLINSLMNSVGAVFFSYDMYVDGVVTFYSKVHVESEISTLNANSYKGELRNARNPFREMDAVTFYTRTFNRLVEKTMGLLQSMWGGTRWLRTEVQLCTSGRLPPSSISYVPQSVSQCASLLADCIIASWPHQRRERSPFRRVPRRGSVAEYSALKAPLLEDDGSINGGPLTTWSREGTESDFTRTDYDVTHRSIDSMFADLVITNEADSAQSSLSSRWVEVCRYECRDEAIGKKGTPRLHPQPLSLSWLPCGCG
eukprot:gene13260-9103_t